jgi:hypothetical protein
MEENTKEIKMNPDKPTYEQLSEICQKFEAERNYYYKKLQEFNLANLYKRLDYLFKVMENSEKFSADFVVSCADEIEKAITIPEDTEDSKESDN